MMEKEIYRNSLGLCFQSATTICNGATKQMTLEKVACPETGLPPTQAPNRSKHILHPSGVAKKKSKISIEKYAMLVSNKKSKKVENSAKLSKNFGKSDDSVQRV